jgi:hypothetical protein
LARVSGEVKGTLPHDLIGNPYITAGRVPGFDRPHVSIPQPDEFFRPRTLAEKLFRLQTLMLGARQSLHPAGQKESSKTEFTVNYTSADCLTRTRILSNCDYVAQRINLTSLK